ncbi:hypothetical protein GH714_013923 [Hevea brasiliensis]|uniref:PLAC8 family protein n=1 Tax=Hevea brasiliensis TaxID=3981 RepID=A0A6A6N0F0_HEVBR|nr:hypothetical protein GH714_013923 [Hevea brasiliensis]
MSRSVASSSSHGLRERMKEIDWAFLMKTSKEWIRDPMNMALFVWIVCVAISGAILFLVMTGMLKHPKRFYHLVLLCRWKPEDISRLRKIYCKNGIYKPHEWAHMMVVVILLHVNCFAQYALCGLNLGYKRSERPAIGVGICISFAIAAPAIAGVYTIISPLGRDYSEFDEEAQHQITAGEGKRPEQLRRKSLEKRYSFATRDEGSVETRPQWSGGILDFGMTSLAYLSLFCSFCVLDGIWRGLDLETSVSDCTLWLCCCWCSLAQEVRTGNSYDIVEDKFYRKHVDSSNYLQPSPREDVSGPSSPLGNNRSPSKTLIANSPSPSRVSNEYRQLFTVKEESSAGGKDETMTPPSPTLIEREAT